MCGIQLIYSWYSPCLVFNCWSPLDNTTQIWSDNKIDREGLVLCRICLVWSGLVLSNWSICLSGIKYEMQVLISTTVLITGSTEAR